MVGCAKKLEDFMQSKPISGQGNLFMMRLDQILNRRHPLYALANVIEWSEFDESFGALYSPDQGRPAKSTRLMVGLHYLKHANDLSDEEVVAKWVENPYWQYFCGYEYFEHEFPIEPSLMTKWRNRIKSEGLEKLLEETIKAGLKTKVVKRSSFKKVNVDTTVQEKNVTYPTDAKLYHRMRERLVKEARESGIELRQSYRNKIEEVSIKAGPVFLCKADEASQAGDKKDKDLSWTCCKRHRSEDIRQ
jgi:IS5 family transposase